MNATQHLNPVRSAAPPGRMAPAMRWGIVGFSVLVSIAATLVFTFDWKRTRLEPGVTWPHVAMIAGVCAVVLMWGVLGAVSRSAHRGGADPRDAVFFARVTGWIAGPLVIVIAAERAGAPHLPRVLGGLIGVVLLPPVWWGIGWLARRCGVGPGYTWLAPVLAVFLLFLGVSVTLHW